MTVQTQLFENVTAMNTFLSTLDPKNLIDIKIMTGIWFGQEFQRYLVIFRL